MSAEQMTTSVALYFESFKGQRIPLSWYERAYKLFADYKLSPVFFTAQGGIFTYDDCYLLEERGSDLTRFGDTVRARRSELIDALSAGEIQYLQLDSTRKDANDREDWRAMVNIAPSGQMYLGIDEQLISEPISLLRRAYDMTLNVCDVRYGIAYKMVLAEHPDCYASGFLPKSVSQVFDMVRHRDQWAQRKRGTAELWREELNGEKRHLRGFFRGAYLASILCDAHVELAALRSRGVGRLTEFDKSLWLWELTDSEIPIAEKILESRRVLVGEATMA